LHFVQLDKAKTLRVDLPLRCDSGATFVVKSPSGGTVQSSASVTRNGVDTTVSGALAVGATTLTVLSATGIKRGKRYAIGNAGNGTAANEERGGEVVTVKGISGTTVTLARPLTRAQDNGALFQSREVELAIASTTPTTVGRHWRAEITWSADDGTAASTVSQSTFIVPFDVVRFDPVSTATEDDLFDMDPVAPKRLPAGLVWHSLRDRAWEMILRRVAAKVDPGALVGTIDLTSAHVYLIRALLAETAGQEPERVQYRELMAQRFGEEFEAAVSTQPVDNDQDGAVERHEGVSMHTIDLRRG
jgi:hypothetical protein